MVTFVIPQRHVALFNSVVWYTSDYNDIIMQKESNPKVLFEILVLSTLVYSQIISRVQYLVTEVARDGNSLQMVYLDVLPYKRGMALLSAHFADHS